MNKWETMRLIKYSLLVMHLLVSAVVLANDLPAPTVFAGGESLQGEYSQISPDIKVFKGIPYAEPPVNELRWQAPKPHEAREGRQRATEFASACFQDNYNTLWYQKVGAAFGAPSDAFSDPNFSEDCLYLNVWAPSSQISKKLPVMVWIHGGSNKAGWSFEYNYWGDRLAQSGQVVVVSIAYRLGVFGFFSHPELVQSDAPANFGLLDQVAALKWVQQNIHQFGGDKNNVTVFGESAGAANIGNLMLSPLADGLFQRAISQSGGFQLWENVSLEQQSSLGRDLAQSFGIKSNSLSTLKTLSAQKVFKQVQQIKPEYHFGAAIDNKVLMASSMQLLAKNSLKVDLLIGSNQDEWLMYLDNSKLKLNEFLASQPASIIDIMKARAESESSVARGYDQISTLIDMVCPSYEYAKQVSQSQKSAFIYRFKQVRQGQGGEQLGAYHGAEIPFVFDSHDPWFNSTQDDFKLTSRMIRYWTNFAKSGNPNSPESVDLIWPKFKEDNPQIIVLTAQSEVLAAPDFALCKKIMPYLKRALF